MKTGIFIDGPNLYAAAKALNADIDYKAFLRWASQTYKDVVHVSYYTTVPEDEEGFSSMHKLLDWLGYNGYRVRSKPTKIYTNGERTRHKGNMYVELSVDMLEQANTLEHIVLVSGDGDFLALVEAVQRRGARVDAISVLKPLMIGAELRQQVDQFIDLADLGSAGILKASHRVA